MKIPAYNYIHPEDKAALENLKNIPMFTACLKAFMKFLPEQYLHGMNMDCQHLFIQLLFGHF